MKAPVVFVILLVVVAGCNFNRSDKQAPAITKDTLTYKYQNFKQRADDCGNKPDSGCTVITIKYPLFSGEGILNDTVMHHLTNLFKISEDAGKTIPELAKQFIDTYHKQKIVPRHRYSLITNAVVVRQDSNLVTMQLTGYNFMGGAHGSTVINFINWDTASQRTISLADIFVPGYQKQLTAIGEKIFRKTENLADTASLKTNYFFDKGTFSLNNNFLITPLGIRFLYNQYEIKPYAAGQTELFIPYAQIKALLKPHSVVSQFHK